MGSTFIWIPEAKLLIKTLAGDHSLDDVLASMEREVELGYAGNDIRKVIDMRTVSLKMTADDINALADWYRDRGLTSVEARTAVVASTPVPTALAMVYANVLASVRPAKTFATPRAALTWLGFDPQSVVEHWPDATCDD